MVNDLIKTAYKKEESNELEKALELLDQVTVMLPGYHVTYHDKARILVKLNKMEEALECYNKIIELKPDIPETFFYRGEILYI